MDEESEFDSIIEAVGNNGKFQKRFNWAFNFALIFVAAMPYQNIINSLAVPDHWCFIPGRESTNYTLDEWKTKHLPKDNSSIENNGFSNCQMFTGNILNGTSEEINCQNGWEYDKTWYDLTAPSQGSWVCNDSINVANAFIFSRLGEVIGSMIFGQLADTIGRKPVFFITVILVAIGRMLLIVTWHSVPLFFLVMFLGSFPSYSIFQGPLVIAMEISKTENRAYIAMLQCISATLGVCSLPLMMWVLRDWRYFIAVSTLPCIVFIFFGKFMIESPRWLANRGKASKCIRELETIARMNNTKVPDNIASILTKFNGEREKIYGIMGLFSSWRLTKNGTLLMLGWSSAMLIYYTFTFNINNLEGNPFMNFFWQGIAEIPAYFAAKYTSDYLGRRWTNFIAFAGTFLGCIPILFIIHGNY
ncbi:PREDICTED: organic cation transporter 1-like [Nicrophorus vespilloides]|uniref:Organic cation transporter 1-like n=1 Tax=Nicrophorus vespilloides TaxID=110193 RepID=A0ABM1NKE9_NICVS|nr:PREDICTED: organic cation transporter 1-like [Nicrophorus vespilloides]